MRSFTNSFIDELEKAINGTLPGVAAQLKMANFYRQHQTKSFTIPDNTRKAGVLNLLYPHQDTWHIVLMKRAVFDPKKDKHSGQVSFPGGRYEETDPSMKFTALREAEEEIGINADEVRVLGKITNLYIPVSNYLVYPYIAVSDKRPDFLPNEREVAELIEVPISKLLNNEKPLTTSIKLQNGAKLENVPYFDANGHIVWGATAMMLSEFATLVNGILSKSN